MKLKYIFIPKINSGESTALKRMGIVFYWIGNFWCAALFFTLIVTGN